MCKKRFDRNDMAVYISSFFSYQIYMAGMLLPGMYNWFPDVSADTVILLYSAPQLLSAVLSLALGPVLLRIDKKRFLLAGLFMIFAGGALIVFTNGALFSVSLAGTLLCGAGYALILTISNTLLVEGRDAEKASRGVAINSAAGCLGSMILMALAGIIAKDGDWTRAYYLCLPVIVPMIVVAVLYRAPVKTENDLHSGKVKTKRGSFETAGVNARKSTLSYFTATILVFVLANFCTMAWNTNYADYIVNELGIGTTVETSIISIAASLGGVIGGFFLTGPMTSRLKHFAAPVSIAVTALPNLVCGMGVGSLPVIYLCSFLSMAFYQIVYGVIITAAGNLLEDGVGVSIASGIVGLTGFAAPFILTAVTPSAESAVCAKMTAGAVFAFAAAVFCVPLLKKIQKLQAR